MAPAPAAAPILAVDHITHHYGATLALDDVSTTVAPGEIVSLLGPSGCGKSTLLRVTVGLETGYAGTVHFDGRPLEGVPVHQRGFGLMFQDFALFPHRSVAENVAFGLRMQKRPKREIAARVAQTLQLVGLDEYGPRTIFALSGGERQRVALARSLAPQPKLLLLDEPLGALDRTLRERLTEELREIIKRVGLTSIYVTHDQAEAFAVADRIVLMNQGRIVQSGTPLEVYQQPRTVFAARFLGFENILPGVVEGYDDGAAVVQTALGQLRVPHAPAAPSTTAVHVVVRPEAASLATEGSPNVVHGLIVRTTFHGASERVVIRHGSGTELEVDLPAGLVPGEVTVALRPEALTVIVGE